MTGSNTENLQVTTSRERVPSFGNKLVAWVVIPKSGINVLGPSSTKFYWLEEGGRSRGSPGHFPDRAILQQT